MTDLIVWCMVFVVGSYVYWKKNQPEKKQVYVERRITATNFNVKGWKLIPCGACNGVGKYDNMVKRRGKWHQPDCSCCEGTVCHRNSTNDIWKLKDKSNAGKERNTD